MSSLPELHKAAIRNGEIAGRAIVPEFSPMSGVYNELRRVVHDVFSQTTHNAHRDRITTGLRDIFTSTRIYMVSDAKDLSVVWTKIRNEAPVTDFLMDVTAQLHMALAGSEVSFDELLGHIAQAYGRHRATFESRNSYASTVVDQDLLARLPTPQTTQALLQTNPWFAALILIAQRPTVLNV